ncbi:MAG: hypothetical protein ACOC41_04085 [Chitinivibrionales bacterium]
MNIFAMCSCLLSNEEWKTIVSVLKVTFTKLSGFVRLAARELLNFGLKF